MGRPSVTHRIAIVVCGLALLVALGVPALARAGGWAVEPVASPMTPGGELSGLTCSSASSCTTVGGAVDDVGHDVALAERWNGRAWTVQPIAIGQSPFAALACVSSTTCFAVGASGASRWNGRVWVAQKSPLSSLSGIACWSARGCIAVGLDPNANDGYGSPTAERWDGTRWTKQHVPSPFGGGGFVGISCPTSRACMAVGFISLHDSNGDTLSLAETWDGRRWTIQSSPDAGSTDQLYAASCLQPRRCVAVGSYFNAAGDERPMIMRFERGVWSFNLSVHPTGATSGRLVSISCARRRACTAAGWYAKSNGPERGYLEQWTGGRWFAGLRSASAVGAIDGVACQSQSSCITVGEGPGSAGLLAARWGGAVGPQTTPVPDPPKPIPSALEGVSCPAINGCVAVGEWNVSSSPAPLADVWAGSTWTAVELPEPPRTNSAQLHGVSCVSLTTCIAVGEFSPSSGSPSVLIEALVGATWRVMPAPQPPMGSLRGISCASATACVAVGTLNGQNVLAEVWDGSRWTIASPSLPPQTQSGQLAAVSCPAAGACTAVGTATTLTGLSEPFAVSWNGSAWSTEVAATAGSNNSGSLAGVSCPSVTACTAVGSGPSVQAWNGTTWSSQVLPIRPAGNGAAALIGVSCPTTTACTAAGSDGLGLLEPAWNGISWSLQGSPLRPPAQLSGLSCPSQATCVAVGASQNIRGERTPIAERFSG